MNQRQRDLENKIRDEYEILKEYEDKKRFNEDPRTTRKLQADIDRTKQQIKEYESELEFLQNSQKSVSPDALSITANRGSQILDKPLMALSSQPSGKPVNSSIDNNKATVSNIEFEAAFQCANKAYTRRTGQSLNPQQRAILQGAWQGLSYEQIASIYKQDKIFLEKQVAPRLWEILSESFKEKLNKSNFKSVIKKHLNLKIGLTSVSESQQLPKRPNTSWQYVRSFSGHTSCISAMTVSVDGKLLASGSEDGSVKLWNLETGSCLKTLGSSWMSQKHNKPVHVLTFNPNGEILASGSEDRTVIIWNVNTGRPRYRPLSHQNPVYSIAISQDGKFLASGGADTNIKIWDLHSGNLMSTLMGHRGAVKSLSFHPNGHLLISAGDDKTIKFWDRITGKLENTLPETNWSAKHIAIGDNGKILAICYTDDCIEVKNCQTGEDLYALKGNLITISSDEKMLATASHRTISIWDAEIGELKFPNLNVGKGIIRCLSFGKTDKTIIFSQNDMIQEWKILL